MTNAADRVQAKWHGRMSMTRLLIILALLVGMLARQATPCPCVLARPSDPADSIKMCSRCQNSPKQPPASPHQVPTPCGKCQVSKHLYSSTDSNPLAEPLASDCIEQESVLPQSCERFSCRGQSQPGMQCGQTGLVVQRE
jgi:hypothetical protein